MLHEVGVEITTPSSKYCTKVSVGAIDISFFLVL